MSNTLKNARAWPVREALRVIERMQEQLNKPLSQKFLQEPNTQTALFETGYSPSGLPHLGTAGEVIRVLMIQKAFDELVQYHNDTVKQTGTGQYIKSALVAFIDDMDGLRKVPLNVPQQEMMQQYLGFPLTKIPDPFGCCETFAEHNTKRLRTLLDQLNCLSKIHLCSSTEFYTSGKFNHALQQTLKHHQEILDLMLPTLGEERKQTYSPFLPISPVSGKVLQVPIADYNADKGEISFTAEDGNSYTQTIYNGMCKLQWKPDFGMRWYALGIDYEMYGKDLIHTAELSREICEILKGSHPVNMHYELFLSETGGRISKSKGNESLTLAEWMDYTPRGCLEYFLFQNPQRAKRIRAEDVPVYVENYLQHLHIFKTQSQEDKEENAVYYITACDQYSTCEPSLSYKIALSIACAYNIMDFDTFKTLFTPKHILDAHIIESAYNFYKHIIQSEQKFENIPAEYKPYCLDLMSALKNVSVDQIELKDAYQTVFFQIAKDNNIPPAIWFETLYKAVLGTAQGPKLGTFCFMYGVKNFCNKLESMF